MHISRIYYPLGVHLGGEVLLPREGSHHVLNVLRLQLGAPLVIFNGQGGEYQARLISNEGKQARIHIDEFVERDVESPLQVYLGQGISRGERMDYVVQKAVELGVGTIAPLLTKRCGVQLPGDRLKRRVERWQSIAIGAAEQSGRVRVPEVGVPCALNEWVSRERPEGSLCLVLDHRAPLRLTELAPSNAVVFLIIGPEGGLDPLETAHAEQSGFQAVSLGPRILRTETAAVAVLSALQLRWGDF